MVNDTSVSAFSGAVTQSADVGLPDLGAARGMSETMQKSAADKVPAGNQSLSASGALSTAMEFLSGSHDFRVFVNGTDQSRVQLQDRMAEKNLVRNGDEVWLYDSKVNEATHLTISAELAATAKEKAAAFESKLPTEVSTPDEIARSILKNLDPSTTISVGTDSRVAGRSVYELVLTPKSVDTLVASVSIAVDSETGFPLQITILADGQNAPAMKVGYTSIDLSAPNANVFDFVPPANATVIDQVLPALPEAASGPNGPISNEHAVVTGAGWSSILAVPASPETSAFVTNRALEQLTEQVDGGRAVSTSLLTVFLTADGRIFAGAVPLSALQAAAR
jgi:outer membrane lipoprotein-sorting protein